MSSRWVHCSVPYVMLGESGVRPLANGHCLFVLCSSEVNGSAGFSDIDGFFVAWAVEFVYSFTSAGRWTTFVFGAEDVLKFVAAFMEKITACF